MLKYYIFMQSIYPSSFNMIHRLSNTIYRNNRISEGVMWILTINLIRVRHTYEISWVHFWVCLWGYFQRVQTEVVRQVLNVLRGTTPGIGSHTEWKGWGEKKASWVWMFLLSASWLWMQSTSHPAAILPPPQHTLPFPTMTEMTLPF